MSGMLQRRTFGTQSYIYSANPAQLRLYRVMIGVAALQQSPPMRLCRVVMIGVAACSNHHLCVCAGSELLLAAIITSTYRLRQGGHFAVPDGG